MGRLGGYQCRDCKITVKDKDSDGYCPICGKVMGRLRKPATFGGVFTDI